GLQPGHPPPEKTLRGVFLHDGTASWGCDAEPHRSPKETTTTTAGVATLPASGIINLVQPAQDGGPPMIQQAVCPRCGNTVIFPKDQNQVPCPQCGVTLARKGTVRRPEPEPEPPPGPPTGKRRRRKKARGRQGRKLIPLAIAGSFVLGLLLVGSLVWAL